ncbi:BPIB6 protein, partial [Nothocercus julius]|nr:BPIB6 protein [Nothocercus julius]
KDIQPPVITLGLCPGTGLFMAVLVRMTITGKGFMGGNMEIKVAANLTAQGRLAQDALGTPRFSSENCHIALISVKTNLPSKLLPKALGKFLDRILQKVLPTLLCPAVDAVLSLVNAKLAPMTSEMPLGPTGTLRYTLLHPPAVNETFIQLDLKTVLREKEGAEMELPAEQPPLTALPPKTEAATQLVLSAAFLGAALHAQPDAFALDVTDTMVLGLPPLMTSMLGTLIPEVSAALPPSQPLLIAMRVASAPLVTVTPRAASVRLSSTATFMAGAAGAAPQPLFVLDVVTEGASVVPAVWGRAGKGPGAGCRCGGRGPLTSLVSFQEQPLRGVLADVIHVAYAPSINEALRGGIPLPELLGTRYGRAALRGAQVGRRGSLPCAVP